MADGSFTNSLDRHWVSPGTGTALTGAYSGWQAADFANLSRVVASDPPSGTEAMPIAEHLTKRRNTLAIAASVGFVVMLGGLVSPLLGAPSLAIWVAPAGATLWWVAASISD